MTNKVQSIMEFISLIDPELRPAFRNLPPILVGGPEAAMHIRSTVGASLTFGSPSLDGNREDRFVPGPAGAGEVKVRLYRPERPTRDMPALVWLHGGGYFMGDIEMEDGWLIVMARQTRCVIISVEYRLAPENPFPAGLEDSYAALLWAYRNAPDLGIDPARIAIGGESGGGGLAAGLGLYARDKGEVPVAYQLLMSPMIDDRGTTPANRMITDPRLYNAAFGEQLWRFYLGDDYGTSNVSPYAAAARAQDVSNLPATFISLGQLDLFVDESVTYAQRLINAGVPTELIVYPGAFHGFNRFAPEARLSQKVVTDRDFSMIRALHG